MIEIGQRLGSLLFERLHLVRNRDLRIGSSQGPEFGDLAFQLGDGGFKIKIRTASDPRHHVHWQIIWRARVSKSTFLRQRMVAVHHLLQPATLDMGIDLRGGDVGMPEHLLHGAQISTFFKQIGGKGMAQYMWRNALCVYAAAPRQLLQFERKMLPRQIAWPPMRGKQPLAGAVPGARPHGKVAGYSGPRLSETGTSRSRPPLPLMARKRVSEGLPPAARQPVRKRASP